MTAAIAAYAAIAILASEFRLRARIRMGRLPRDGATPAFPPLRTIARVAAAICLALLTGAIIDRDVRLVDVSRSANSQPIQSLVQALLGGELAAVALLGTGLAIAVQLRASAYGPDIATALLKGRRFLVASVPALGSLVAGALLLGHWDQWSSARQGLLTDLVLWSGSIGVALIAVTAYTGVRRLSSTGTVVAEVAAVPAAPSWAFEIAGFDDRHIDFPPSGALMAQLLLSACRNSDGLLFELGITVWTRAIRDNRFVAATVGDRGHGLSYAQRETLLPSLSTIALSAHQQALLCGIDILNSRILRLTFGDDSPIRNAAMAGPFLAGFTASCFPPILLGDEHPPGPWLAQDIPPGYRTLDFLCRLAIRVRSHELVSDVIRFHLSEMVVLSLRRWEHDRVLDEHLPDWNFLTSMMEAYTELAQTIEDDVKFKDDVLFSLSCAALAGMAATRHRPTANAFCGVEYRAIRGSSRAFFFSGDLFRAATSNVAVAPSWVARLVQCAAETGRTQPGYMFWPSCERLIAAVLSAWNRALDGATKSSLLRAACAVVETVLSADDDEFGNRGWYLAKDLDPLLAVMDLQRLELFDSAVDGWVQRDPSRAWLRRRLGCERREQDRKIDAASEDSFPCSDPPSVSSPLRIGEPQRDSP